MTVYLITPKLRLNMAKSPTQKSCQSNNPFTKAQQIRIIQKSATMGIVQLWGAVIVVFSSWKSLFCNVSHRSARPRWVQVDCETLSGWWEVYGSVVHSGWRWAAAFDDLTEILGDAIKSSLARGTKLIKPSAFVDDARWRDGSQNLNFLKEKFMEDWSPAKQHFLASTQPQPYSPSLWGYIQDQARHIQPGSIAELQWAVEDVTWTNPEKILRDASLNVRKCAKAWIEASGGRCKHFVK